MPRRTPRRTPRIRTRLIPREALFGGPGPIRDLTISRDGSRLAFVAAVEKVNNICVAPLDDPFKALSVTDERPHGVGPYFWSYNPDYILYLKQSFGGEDWQLCAVNIHRTDGKTDLTPAEGVQARMLALSPRFPNEVLVSMNDRDPRLHDVHRINFVTGESQLVQRNDFDATTFYCDADFRPRAALVVFPSGDAAIMTPSPSGEWEPTMRIGAEDTMTTHALGFDASGRTMYMADSRGRDTSALMAVDTDTFEARELAADSRSDVTDYMLHPQTHHVQAVGFERERFEWRAVDDSISADLDRLRRESDSEPQVPSRSFDDRKWIVKYERHNGVSRFYLYDRDAGSLKFLLPDNFQMEKLKLAPMRSTTIRSRDGLELVVYYTLPLGMDADVPPRPLPTVLLVHGGPWGRDSWRLDPFHQMLASRGYAVIAVNFRGSTGFGKAFVNAGNREWAGKMHDDLLDTVDWAVERGISDRDRVAIMGGSYGGYAALVGLTFTPDVFACGVDIVGPSDLNTLIESSPPYWIPNQGFINERVGDNTTEEGRRFLASRSPLSRVDAITKPLLIAQGGNDPRVSRGESDQIVDAMKARDIPVTYLMFPDMGHSIEGSQNMSALMAVIEAFLAKHIGGASEPFGAVFRGSSITVLDGASEVPGLKAAAAAHARYNRRKIRELQKLGARMQLLPERSRRGRLQ